MIKEKRRKMEEVKKKQQAEKEAVETENSAKVSEMRKKIDICERECENEVEKLRKER